MKFTSVDEYVLHLEKENAKFKRMLGKPTNNGSLSWLYADGKPRVRNTYTLRGDVSSGSCSIHGDEDVRVYADGYHRCRPCENPYQRARRLARVHGETEFRARIQHTHPGPCLIVEYASGRRVCRPYATEWQRVRRHEQEQQEV